MKQQIEEALGVRYIKLHFTVKMLEDTWLPSEKVSAIRGGMGEMLLRANCVRNRDCMRCDFESECIVRRTMYSKYEIIPRFVTTNDSVGYILECENYEEEFYAGDLLKFNLVLFGRTIAYFNQYMQAFFALGREGIGKEHSRFEVVSVVNTKRKRLFSAGMVYMENYQIQTMWNYVEYRMRQIQKGGCKNKLVFQTPLTLKYHEEFQESFHMEAIWNAVRRRIYMLECYEGITCDIYTLFHNRTPISVPGIVRQEHEWISVRRYSSTQEKKMRLSGMKGYAEMAAIPEVMLPVLVAGELTHIGKNTSFGFGRYRLM
ncbi:MAG: CRISPR system precrRNA processing endoribonuclease RAMP protein Cas6 [Lachnospiraceae bacterium]|nr:CRISPR system precrRNA processing endoribonuclease RAMP protein Cas6 [Lachnospiraceae bacterium]